MSKAFVPKVLRSASFLGHAIFLLSVVEEAMSPCSSLLGEPGLPKGVIIEVKDLDDTCSCRPLFAVDDITIAMTDVPHYPAFSPS